MVVTIFSFAAIDSSLTLWNVSQHLMNLMTLILELFLNNMSVRANHYPYNISWAMLYLIFIWSVVAMNRISSWPYSFLAVDNRSCFFYYFLLLLADISFYYIFYSLSWLKYYIRNTFVSKKIYPTINKKNNLDNDEECGLEFGDIYNAPFCSV